MQEHQVRPGGALIEQEGAIQPVVADALRQRIVQRLGEQLAHALHGVLPPGNRVGPVVEATGHRLARGLFIQPGDRRAALRVAGQPGALEQALGVDHQVVVDLAQALLEAAPLAALDGLPEVLAPATDSHRNDLRHRRMPGRNLGEALFHHPVELDAGNGASGVGQRGQGMDDVAQGRRLDQQNPHARDRPDRLDRPPAGRGLRAPAEASARAGSCSGRSDTRDRSTGCIPGRGGRFPPGRPAAG
ncbi:hypothetical protein D3C80_1295140 [compost metagenome]